MQAIYDTRLGIQTKNPPGICQKNGLSKPKIQEKQAGKIQVDQPIGGGLESQSLTWLPILL